MQYILFDLDCVILLFLLQTVQMSPAQVGKENMQNHYTAVCVERV